VSVPSTETVSTMGVQWRITPRIDSLDTKKKTYLSCNPEHVCSFYICIPTFYFKTIISALIRRTITIQSQLVLQFTQMNLEIPAQLLAVLSFKRNLSCNAMIILLNILFLLFFFIVISQHGRSSMIFFFNLSFNI
jgi:hypothetical protein